MACPTNPSFQTQAILRRLLDGRGLRPRKRYGQHFLIDERLMRRLVESAELSRADHVIEVGCGTGSLTTLLAAEAGRVTAFEIDPQVAEVAAEQIAAFDNVSLVLEDALERKSQLSPRLRALLTSGERTLKLVANLPYDVATPLVVMLLLCEPALERLCFSVQKEVGDRLLAREGDDAYGAVSVLVNVLAEGERIARVPRQAFWPQPKVESVFIRLRPRRLGSAELPDRAGFAELVRLVFQQRRKTLGRIAQRLAEGAALVAALKSAGVETGQRPEEVAPGKWLAIWRIMRGNR